MRLFKIINKVTEVIYRLNLLLKIKIYLVYRNYKLLVYKYDIYKGYKEDKWPVKKIL